MREIAIDTETTGLSAIEGDRITEIGCVEIIDKRITGKIFHSYINPEREVSEEATKISGLTYDFLKSHRKFEEVIDEFLDFIKHDRIVIHNAPFDMSFFNYQFEKAGKKPFDNEVLDTLRMARKKYPGAMANLNALCEKFGIDTSMRIKHGALIDAELLAHVYIAMSVQKTQKDILSIGETEIKYIYDNIMLPRKFEISSDEAVAHEALLQKIPNPYWYKHLIYFSALK